MWVEPDSRWYDLTEYVSFRAPRLTHQASLSTGCRAILQVLPRPTQRYPLLSGHEYRITRLATVLLTTQLNATPKMININAAKR